MRTLFSWLGWSDPKAFCEAFCFDETELLERAPLINTLIREDDLLLLNSLLDQAVFEKIYLFYHFHFEFEGRFKEWLRPDVKLVFIDLNDKFATVPQLLLIKLASMTHEFKIDLGILPRGTSETEDMLKEICTGRCFHCYNIKDGKLVEHLKEEQNGTGI